MHELLFARSSRVAAALIALILVALPACGESGACVTGDKVYFCNEDSEDKCQNFWCDSTWTYCGYFAGASCSEVGFPEGTSSLQSYSEPRSADWSRGTPGAGGSSGGGSGSCTSTYQGPTGDPQVSTQCMSVWNYRCQQHDDAKADQNCSVYASLEATVSCPYCP